MFLSSKMIEAKNITKIFKVRNKISRFKDVFFPKHSTLKALDNVSLNIKKGEIFALLGPNGAGKTTLIRILSSLLQPTKGEVFIDNKTIDKSRGKIGLMLGSTMIYYRITGYDNLEYFAKLYNVKDYKGRINDLAAFLGLQDFLNECVERYSEGMKTKLALARALIHDPDILFLDEPTLGLDPNISVQIRNKLNRLRDKGKTIILTTHYMEEADYMSDRVGILNHGRLVKIDTPTNLKKLVGTENATLLDSFIKLTGEKL